IPDISITNIILDKNVLLHALERVSLLAGEGQLVQILLSDDPLVKLISRNSEIGDISEQITPEAATGDSIKISFNSKLLLEIVRTCTERLVKLSLCGSLGPIVVRPSPGGLDSTFLLTPIRTAC